MNRRFFGRKAGGVFAAIVGGLTGKVAVAGKPSNRMVSKDGWIETNGWWTFNDTAIDNSYRLYGVGLRGATVVQKDGTKLDHFVFQISECGTSWRLKYKCVDAEGKTTDQSIHCDSSDSIHVNRKGLDRIQVGTAATFFKPKRVEEHS